MSDGYCCPLASNSSGADPLRTRGRSRLRSASGHSRRDGRWLWCPLSGVKQTCRLGLAMSANDPKRTFQTVNSAGTAPVVMIKLLLANSGAAKCDGGNFWALWA
jgi:hypothetical protein